MSEKKNYYKEIKGLPIEVSVTKKFPELTKLLNGVKLESTSIKDTDRAIRFVVLLYSLETDLIKQFYKHEDRENKAADLSLLGTTVLKSEANRQALNKMASNYFLMQNNEEFELWYSLRIRYSNLNEKLREKDEKADWKDEKDALDCAEKAMNLQTKLKTMNASLFGDYEEMKKIMLENSETTIKEGYAEKHAQNYGG
jgi:hypothetical protein